MLKQRIPSLSDEIVPGSPIEASIRTALTELLREKGINTIVQSFDPPMSVTTSVRVSEAPQFNMACATAGMHERDLPPVSIEFRFLDPPKVFIEKLVLENPPQDLLDGSFNETANSIKGKQYAAESFWLYKTQIIKALQQLGYLSATVTFQAGQPKKDGESYLVPVIATINSGSKYHVARIEVDGGALLQDKNLLPLVTAKAEDVATPDAFVRLEGMMRATYCQSGYEDVDFDDEPTLDTAHALAAYHIKVIPGAIYHLRSLTIDNLDATQQELAKQVLGLKPGDVFDYAAVAGLNQKLFQPDIALKGYGCTYITKEDKVAHVIDLTLRFFRRQGDK
jgi:outer membrane protein assembly factor BamA